MNNRIDMATSPFHSRESTPAPKTFTQTSYPFGSSPEGLNVQRTSSLQGLRPFLKKHGMKLLTIPVGLAVGAAGYGIAKLKQRQEQQRLQNEQVRKPIMHTIY